MRAILFIIFCGFFVACSSLQEDELSRLVITNTPIVVNTPEMFSYAEKAENKNEVFSENLQLLDDSVQVSVQISSMRQGILKLILANTDGTSRYQKKFISDTSYIETIPYHFSKITIELVDNTSVFELSVAD